MRTEVFACVLVLATLACSKQDAPPYARHAILISIDTLRPDHLGSYGYPRPTSPALDELSRQGVRFEDVTSASPWTLPSHASMLTGLYPCRHGLKSYEQKLGATTPTLAQILSEQGFATKAVVNSHSVSERYGFEAGFQQFHYLSEWSQEGNRRNTANSGSAIVDEAIQWLRASVDSGKRMFLFLHFYDVHSDFSPPPEYRRQFERPYAGTITGQTDQLLKLRAENATLSPADVEHLEDLYDAEIRQLDDQLARLFRFLDESGLSAETLTVVTSDHGEEFFEHGSLLHGRTHYQEVLSIPLIMRGPGLPRAQVVKEPVALVDIAPTLLSLLRIDARSPLDGLNLTASWTSPQTLPKHRVMFAEADHNNEEPDILRTARQGSFKLIVNRLRQSRSLHDLSADPGESKDLSATHPALLEALNREIERFQGQKDSAEQIGMPSAETLELLRTLGYVK